MQEIIDFINDNAAQRQARWSGIPVPMKLLLADDSVTIQRVIELTFADEDVQVIAVGDGQQAIDRIDRDRPDIVLADIGMPERDGYEVAAFIKNDPQLAHSLCCSSPARSSRSTKRARGRRVRRRAGQAVRAADGDQPREGTARRHGVPRHRRCSPTARRLRRVRRRLPPCGAARSASFAPATISPVLGAAPGAGRGRKRPTRSKPIRSAGCGVCEHEAPAGPRHVGCPAPPTPGARGGRSGHRDFQTATCRRPSDTGRRSASTSWDPELAPMSVLRISHTGARDAFAALLAAEQGYRCARAGLRMVAGTARSARMKSSRSSSA